MELKYCPFCGSKDWQDIIHPPTFGHEPDPDVGVREFIQCTTPGCYAKIVEYVDEGRAVANVVAAWNRRVNQV